MKNIDETIRQETADDGFSMVHLTFQMDGQHYGIPIGNVIEILKIQPRTELPELPYYSKGIINLRGRIIPLIDVNLLFGKPEKEYTDRTSIIIVDIDELHTGLIVDTVEEVLDIDSKLTSSPPLFGDISSNYVTRVAKMDNNMVLLLDVSLLVSKASYNMSASV